jgi:hypothetical protein
MQQIMIAPKKGADSSKGKDFDKSGPLILILYFINLSAERWII